MNKELSYATKDLMYFLNCGDVCCNSSVFQKKSDSAVSMERVGYLLKIPIFMIRLRRGEYRDIGKMISIISEGLLITRQLL